MAYEMQWRVLQRPGRATRGPLSLQLKCKAKIQRRSGTIGGPGSRMEVPVSASRISFSCTSIASMTGFQTTEPVHFLGLFANAPENSCSVKDGTKCSGHNSILASCSGTKTPICTNRMWDSSERCTGVYRIIDSKRSQEDISPRMVGWRFNRGGQSRSLESSVQQPR